MADRVDAEPGGIPSDPGARGRWLKRIREERTCDTARACVDAIATLAREIDGADADTKCKLVKAIGELLSRAVAADKHAEVLETATLRERAEAQRAVTRDLGALH